MSTTAGESHKTQFEPPHGSCLVSEDTSLVMEASRKSSSYSHDIPSPVLLRRRLSAPETIMRKHTLAQQCSNSQETETRTHFRWGTESTASSDPNLFNKKRDYNLMRKSTLLRRLWNGNKPLSRSQDWHKMSMGRSTQSLASAHASPEHVLKRNFSGSDVKVSPNRKVFSPQHININQSPKRKTSVYNGNFDSMSFRSDTMSTPLENKASSRKDTDIEVCSNGSNTTKYTYSSFTTCSDNIDSAYSNSFVSSNNNSNNEIVKTIAQEEEVDNKDAQKQPDFNSNNNTDEKINESSTQTPEVTNLNVISNVKLSQSTLDVIFNHVMQDVNNMAPKLNQVTVSSTCIEKPQDMPLEKIPSFFLNPQSSQIKSIECSRVDKYILSNVETGSPYTESSDVAQVVVPRFSALPRTTSMEVNTSNGDSEEKEESDTLSLVDSLEDFNSPRILKKNKNLDISRLLPECSSSSVKKSASFFIPIEINKDREVKAVSELLPTKVREKLIKREIRRTEKNMQSKVENYTIGNESNMNTFSNMSPKKKNKPFLPNINAPIRKNNKIIKKDKKINIEPNKNKMKQSQKQKRTLDPLFSNNKNDFYECETQKVYHKEEYQDSHKRIEILQIMECSDPSKKLKEKSKIPIPVATATSLKSKQRSACLEYESSRCEDPKLDQLLANILIDTLHSSGIENASCSQDYNNALAANQNNNSPEHRITSAKNGNAKYKQKFEVIPEELSVQSSTDEVHNNNSSENSKKTNKVVKNYQGKAALALVQDENFASIPKGWITFYTLRRDIGTPDSTSDEGLILEKSKPKEISKENKLVMTDECAVEKELTKLERMMISSSSDESKLKSSSISTRHRKFNNGFQKKFKQKNCESQNTIPGEWSVTISGTNTNGQFAPNVEMRLRFSNNLNNFKENNNQSDSGFGDENNDKQNIRTNFPKIDNKIHLATCRRNNKLDRDSCNSLPLICKDPNKSQTISRSESNTSFYTNMVPSLIVPRQTKTSTGRYNFSRPRERYSLPDVSSRCNERQYADIVRKFPHILSVTGRSISPERKSNVASLSEKDF